MSLDIKCTWHTALKENVKRDQVSQLDSEPEKYLSTSQQNRHTINLNSNGTVMTSSNK